MRALLAAVLAAVLAPGCLGLGGPACPDGAAEGSVLTPWVDGGFLRTDPRQPWDTVLLQSGPGEEPEAHVHPAGWSVSMERISPEGADSGAAFSLLRVTPGPGAAKLGVDYRLGGCGAHGGTIVWDLRPPEEGQSAGPGQGVHVLTAGFLEDGTLFYTNIAEVDGGKWPRTEWYAWEGGDPLPVYVYGEDRAEQPAHWKDPQAGTPLAGTVEGVGYYTTIPGFNEALKGLSTSTVRVARLAPEEGYTRPGNEEHPLYGKALVFYVKAVAVVDLPCPQAVLEPCARASESVP